MLLYSCAFLNKLLLGSVRLRAVIVLAMPEALPRCCCTNSRRLRHGFPYSAYQNSLTVIRIMHCRLAVRCRVFGTLKLAIVVNQSICHLANWLARGIFALISSQSSILSRRAPVRAAGDANISVRSILPQATSGSFNHFQRPFE